MRFDLSPLYRSTVGSERIIPRANTRPNRGDRRIAAVVLRTPVQTMATLPAFAVAAPNRPPIKACELLDGT